MTNHHYRKLKRIAVSATKLLLAAVLLYWLSQSGNLDISSLRRLRLDLAGIGSLLIACTSIFVGTILMSWRLILLLRFKRFALTIPTALSLTMIGQLFGAVLPGQVGGDAIKAAYLCANVPERRVDVLGALVVDRIVGMYSLFLLATIALIAAHATGSVIARIPVLLIAPAIIVLITLTQLILVWPALRKSKIVNLFLSLLPVQIRSFLDTMRDYAGNGTLCAVSLGISMLNHSLLIMSYFILGAALLGDTVSVGGHYVLDPLAMSLTAVGITPGGLGIAEGAFAYLFQTAGSPNGAIIGLLGRFVAYTVYGIGGSIALFSLGLRQQIAVLETTSDEDPL